MSFSGVAMDENIFSPSSSMVLTEGILEMGRSLNGGYNSFQMELFGGGMKGWRKRVIGMEFPIWKVEMFLAVRDMKLRPDTKTRLMALREGNVLK